MAFAIEIALVGNFIAQNWCGTFPAPWAWLALTVRLRLGLGTPEIVVASEIVLGDKH